MAGLVVPPVSGVPVPPALVCGQQESEHLLQPEKWLLWPEQRPPEQYWCILSESELRPPKGLESQRAHVVPELVPQAHPQLEPTPELGQLADLQVLP